MEARRKMITVITSDDTDPDSLQVVWFTLPRRFTVRFDFSESAPYSYKLCEEIADAASTYSYRKGETLLVLTSDGEAPHFICPRKQAGNILFSRVMSRNVFRFGDLNEDRNSDHVGSEEELLEYIDSVTTVKDPFSGADLKKKLKSTILTTEHVAVLLVLALTIATAALVLQCVRLLKIRSKRKKSSQESLEDSDGIDNTQGWNRIDSFATPRLNRSFTEVSTQDDDQPWVPQVSEFKEKCDVFPKPELARSLTEILEEPVSPEEFAYYMHLFAAFTTDCYEHPIKTSVTNDYIPGTLYSSITLRAPETPDTFEAVLHDIKTQILPYVTNWQHPRFHGFFPCGRCLPDIIVDFSTFFISMLGHEVETSQSLLELEAVVANWVGRALGLPESFLFQEYPKHGESGGGLVSSPSQAVFYTILAARQMKVDEMVKVQQRSEEAIVRDIDRKFVVYTNKNSHPYVAKACKLASVRCRSIRTTSLSSWGVTGSALEQCIKKDVERGYIPLFAYCSVGTTSTALVDQLDSIGPVANKYDLWLHCDCSFGGNCWIDQRHRPPAGVVEYATSINVSLHKFMLHGHGGLIYTKKLQRFNQSFQQARKNAVLWSDEGEPVLCDWGYDNTRRAQAVRIWLTMRLSGIGGLRYYINNAIEMCIYFARLIESHPCCRIFSRNYSLLCFQYEEPGFNDNQTNKYTKLLCKFMNESRRIFVTSAQVDNNELIGVSITYEKTTATAIETSWAVMKSLIDEFRNRKDDPYLILKEDSSPKLEVRKPLVGESVGITKTTCPTPRRAQRRKSKRSRRQTRIHHGFSGNENFG